MTFQSLVRREMLTSIDLHTNLACVEGTRALARILEGNEKLTSLDLGENSVGQQGVEVGLTLPS